jgi:hypothetical protein
MPVIRLADCAVEFAAQDGMPGANVPSEWDTRSPVRMAAEQDSAAVTFGPAAAGDHRACWPQWQEKGHPVNDQMTTAGESLIRGLADQVPRGTTDGPARQAAG